MLVTGSCSWPRNSKLVVEVAPPAQELRIYCKATGESLPMSRILNVNTSLLRCTWYLLMLLMLRLRYSLHTNIRLNMPPHPE